MGKTKTAAIRIIYKTAAYLSDSNPVLKAGQQAYESDSRKRKTGNGVTAYNDLAYDLGSDGAKFPDSFPLYIPGNPLGKNGMQINAGDDIADVLRSVFRQSNPVVYNSPYAIISANPNPDGQYYEVTQQVVAALSVAFYQQDAGAANGYQIFKNSAIVASANTFNENLSSAIAQSITYVGQVSYGQGPVKNDDFGTPQPSGRIGAGNAITSVKTYRFIFPYFSGNNDNNAGFDVYSSNRIVQPANGNLNINFAAAAPKFLWFAHDADLPTKTAWYVDALNKGSIGGSGNLFASPIVVTVTAPARTGFTGWSKSYKLYVTNFKTAQTALMTIS